ncbi:hypothetical protein ABPG77_004391 [Micractinium sp. CCAP 211/92]
MRNKVLALFALVAALALAWAGSAAAAAAAGAQPAKPPKCAQVPDASFQAAAANMLTLCPELKEDSCPDDCVSALTTLGYECSMAVAVAQANAELRDVEATVDAM